MKILEVKGKLDKHSTKEIKNEIEKTVIHYKGTVTGELIKKRLDDTSSTKEIQQIYSVINAMGLNIG